jgi:hypothetical protein
MTSARRRWFNVTMNAEPEYVLVSRPFGNLLGEYPTLEEAEAVRQEYIALDPRNADAIAIVFDDGSDEPAHDAALPHAS